MKESDPAIFRPGAIVKKITFKNFQKGVDFCCESGIIIIVKGRDEVGKTRSAPLNPRDKGQKKLKNF